MSLHHRVFIAIVLLLGIGLPAYGTEASSLYRQHQNEISGNSVSKIEGYLFSHSSFVSRSASSSAIEGALKRSHFQAKLQLVDEMIADSFDVEPLGLPSRLESNFVSVLRQVLLKTMRFDQSGIELVFEKKTGSGAECVLALPENQLAELSMTAQQARLLILEDAKSGNYELDAIVVAELLKHEGFGAALDYWVEELDSKYGCMEMREAIDFKPISKIPKGIDRIELLSSDEFQAMSFRQALQYSSLFLHFPPYVRAMADKAGSAGFAVTESVFLYLGACYSVCVPDQVYCMGTLESRGLAYLLPEHAGRYAWIGAIMSLDLGEARHLDYILSSFGGFKLADTQLQSAAYQAGNDAFFSDPPNLIAADEFYSKAIEESISSDTCNMLGRCYALNGSFEAAVALLTQSSLLNPRHPYAGANLALALHSSGFNDAAIRQAHRALQNPDISDWARNELRQLLGRIE